MENSLAVPLNVKYGVTILSSNSTPRYNLTAEGPDSIPGWELGSHQPSGKAKKKSL